MCQEHSEGLPVVLGQQLLGNPPTHTSSLIRLLPVPLALLSHLQFWGEQEYLLDAWQVPQTVC